MIPLLSGPKWHANENIALRLNELITAHNLAVEKLDALARQVWRMDAENDAEDDAFDMDWDYYHPPSCPECGMTHEVVRPGKTQPRCQCDEIATLRAKNEALEERIQALRGEVVDEQNKRDRLGRLYIEAEEKRLNLRAKCERLEAGLRMAESDLAKQHDQMGAMDAEVERLRAKNAELCKGMYYGSATS